MRNSILVATVSVEGLDRMDLGVAVNMTVKVVIARPGNVPRNLKTGLVARITQIAFLMFAKVGAVTEIYRKVLAVSDQRIVHRVFAGRNSVAEPQRQEKAARRG